MPGTRTKKRQQQAALARFKAPESVARSDRNAVIDLSWLDDARQAAGRLPTFGQRFVGFLLDWVLFSVPVSAISLYVAFGVFDHARWQARIVIGVVTIAYYVGSTAWYGQTLGKRIVGTRVVRLADGRRPGWGHSLVRYLVVIVPSIVVLLAAYPAYLGSVASIAIFGWILWDPLHQGLHDKVARTLVVRAR